jgi:hypothetical protein
MTDNYLGKNQDMNCKTICEKNVYSGEYGTTTFSILGLNMSPTLFLKKDTVN